MYSATINPIHQFIAVWNPDSVSHHKWASCCSCGWEWRFNDGNGNIIYCKDKEVALARWTTHHSLKVNDV